MSQMVIPISKGANAIYTQLLRRQRPKCLDRLYSSWQVAVDVLAAIYHVNYFLNANESAKIALWLSEKVLPDICRQTAALRPSSLAKFCEFAVERCQKKELSYHAFALPFSCLNDDDCARAAKVFRQVLDVLLTQEGCQGGRFQTFLLFPLLILLQDDFHTWAMLCRGVQTGHSECEAQFVRFLAYLKITHTEPRFCVATPTSCPWYFERNMEPFIVQLITPNDPRSPTPTPIPVPQNTVHACNSLVRNKLEPLSVQRTAYIDFVDAFGQQEAEYQERATYYWGQITANMRYGLRPGGLDHIKIDIPQLRDVGFETIQLIPDGLQFPKVTARLWVAIKGSNLVNCEDHVLTPHEPLKTFAPLTLVGPSHFSALVDKLVQYLALHALYCLTTERPEAAKRCSQGNGSSGGCSIRTTRPHFRTLPDGCKISEEARKRSLATFRYLPPEGMTFVSPSATTIDAKEEIGQPTTRPSLVYSARLWESASGETSVASAPSQFAL